MPPFPATVPLWADSQGLAADPRRSPAVGAIDADVVIVGGGFTGLWTAITLLERRPDRRVVVLEAEHVGFGASGRNGGWCSTALPTGWSSIADRHGPAAARATFAAMAETVERIGRFAATNGIECDFVRGGHLHVARTDAQRLRLHDELAAARSVGDDAEWLDADSVSDRIAVTGALGGVYSPHCAALHPGRLVRGLATVVERSGGIVHERSRVSRIDSGRVTGDGFHVSAPVVLRATEAFTVGLPGHRRTVAPVYSLMIATEPLPDSVWAEIGWRGRETFNDARRLIIYAQRTADGRIAFGGRGAPYHFGSRVAPSFDRDDRVHASLERTLVELFPSVAGVRVTHRWGGPLAIARDWEASIGFDPVSGMGWAGGYVGDGVASSNLAGRTLATLVDGADDPIVRLPWVGHRSRRWEPEPIRWAAVTAALRLTERIDRHEAAGRSASLSNRLLDRLTGS